MSPGRPAVRAALATVLIALGCRRAGEPPGTVGEPLGPVRELSSPAAPGSGEPNLAIGVDGAVYLSWIEPAGSEHALRFAVRPAGGVWSEARTIAQGKGWFVNWADFPAVLSFGEGRLAAHWLARTGPGTYAYEVRVTLSRDGGGTWSPGTVPHRDGTPTEHGFVSFFPWPGVRAGLVWLDGRQTGGRAPRGVGGEMALRQTTVDDEGTLGPEVVLDPRVCECCQTSAARAAEGLIVAYRDRSEAEVRDIATVRYADGGWSAPALVAKDNWKIDGCPVNGPAVAAEESLVAVAWFSAPAESSRVQVAFSSDSGRSYGGPIRVDDGRPVGRVDVAMLTGGDALVSWIEQADKGAEVRVRQVSPSGPRGPSLTVAPSSEARSSGFPRIERSRGEIVLAWRDAADPPRVRTAVLDLP